MKTHGLDSTSILTQLGIHLREADTPGIPGALIKTQSVRKDYIHGRLPAGASPYHR